MKEMVKLTMATKYTALFDTRSLSLSHGFFAFLCKSPQSITISQYVLKIVVTPELDAAMIFQNIPFFKSYTVLITSATIVDKYLRPLNPCIGSFSSTDRRRHWEFIKESKDKYDLNSIY